MSPRIPHVRADGQNGLTILSEGVLLFPPLSSQLLKAVLCSAAPKPIVDPHGDRKRCVTNADVFFRLLNDEHEDRMKMLRALDELKDAGAILLKSAEL